MRLVAYRPSLVKSAEQIAISNFNIKSQIPKCCTNPSPSEKKALVKGCKGWGWDPCPEFENGLLRAGKTGVYPGPLGQNSLISCSQNKGRPLVNPPHVRVQGEVCLKSGSLGEIASCGSCLQRGLSAGGRMLRMARSSCRRAPA